MIREFNNIGRLIRKARLSKSDDFSQHDLSKKLGYKNGQFISNVERGLCNIPFKQIVPISDILDIPIDSLKFHMLTDHSSNIQNEIDLSLHQ